MVGLRVIVDGGGRGGGVDGDVVCEQFCEQFDCDVESYPQEEEDEAEDQRGVGGRSVDIDEYFILSFSLYVHYLLYHINSPNSQAETAKEILTPLGM